MLARWILAVAVGLAIAATTGVLAWTISPFDPMVTAIAFAATALPFGLTLGWIVAVAPRTSPAAPRAVDSVETSIKIAEVAQQHFPHLKIIARARNRSHAFAYLDMGITMQYRETLGSSLEMAEQLSIELGVNTQRAAELIRKFKRHDEESLIAQHAVHTDEPLLVDVSKRYAQQLENVLRSDEEDIKDLRPAGVRELDG